MSAKQAGDDGSHTLILMPSGRRGAVPAGTTLLEAASGMGVSIESICGGKGTCGKCQVILEEGHFPKYGFDSHPASLNPRTSEEKALLTPDPEPFRRLACACKITADLLVTVPEESRGQKQIIRKSAAERPVDLQPALRKVYLELEPARLGDHRGDWGRLQDALESQWGFSGLEIDLFALQQLQPALQEGDHKLTATLWKDRWVIDLQAGLDDRLYGLAVDLGSTTVAAYLSDLRTGGLLATAGAMNPQVPFGEDLMSRISYCTSNRNGLEKLRDLIREAINSLAAEAARQAGIRSRNIEDIVLVGNTTMIHILLGVSPRELGQAPFSLAIRDPLDLKAIELDLKIHPAARAHLLPAQAGHVGGDNVAVLIAEQPYRSEEAILTVDLGTNAEIVLSAGGQLLSASSPTGPAFEGGQISAGMRAAPGAIERVRIDPITKQPRFQVIGEDSWSDTWQSGANLPLDKQPRHLASGICGSGIIEAVAELYTAGLITSSGQFHPGVPSDRMVWDEEKRVGAYLLAAPEQTAMGKGILITQEDVRAIQLAKAALYAGAKLLMEHAGTDRLDRILLAGAFGSYINPWHALVLGLIPDCDPENIYAVGNAAGDGARLASLSLPLREEAARIARRVKYIETAVDPDFQAQFVSAMHLPHSSDPFPHLEEILRAIPHQVSPRRERRFPRRRRG